MKIPKSSADTHSVVKSATIMTEYKCGNCREISRLGPSARFCPYCGSSSLNLIIKEASEEPAAIIPSVWAAPGPSNTGLVESHSQEEKKPRRHSTR